MTALHRLLTEPTLIAFDFDGTLAPIVADPDQVRIRPSWEAHLRHIQQRWPLAVISGRRLADLTPRLGFEPRFVVGNHGAEWATHDTTEAAHVTTATCLDSARQVLDNRFDTLHNMGIEVEDKGLSLAVHYRRSGRKQEAAAHAAKLLATLPPTLEVSHGKNVFNITVLAAPNKGDALIRAVHLCGVEQALYVGDDVNDEPAFAAASPHSVTVRIGSPHTPTLARFTLATHRQLGGLLRTLANRRH